MRYLKENDLNTLNRIEEYRNIVDSDDTILEDIEMDVIAEITSYIGKNYNLEPYFNNTKESFVLRLITKKLFKYYIIERAGGYTEANKIEYSKIINLLKDLRDGKNSIDVETYTQDESLSSSFDFSGYAPSFL